MKNIFLTILLSITLFSPALAQDIVPIVSTDEADTTVVLSKKQLRKLKIANRNVHYNILAGPSYTPDLGLLIGGSALVTFRMDAENKMQQRSVIPMSLAIMLKGGVSIMSKPQLFFGDDRFRIFGKFSYKVSDDNYYGVGYTTNRDYIRSDSTSRYHYNALQLNPWFLFRVKETNIFAGPQIDITYDRWNNPGRELVWDPHYMAEGGTHKGYKNLSSGIGFLLTYDSRDIPANAYSGLYFDVRALIYNKVFGSHNNFARLELDYRQYLTVGKRKVLAWTAQTKNVYGKHIPLNQYALSGTPFDLRGYYMGQYRDKTSHLVMVEYRQMINTDMETRFKRLLSHVGFVAWAGCGFMGPNMVKMEGALPNLGLGLRIEVQPRMNVRFDLGRNTVNKQTLFYFNMTEAF